MPATTMMGMVKQPATIRIADVPMPAFAELS
jgi:hypothetical protein